MYQFKVTPQEDISVNNINSENENKHEFDEQGKVCNLNQSIICIEVRDLNSDRERSPMRSEAQTPETY